MTQPEHRLAIPQGLIPRRSRHWSIWVLLIGMTVSIAGMAGLVGTLVVKIGAAMDTAFPRSHRESVRAKMKNVSPLLKDTIFYTECPVFPSMMDSIQKRAKIVRAQLGTHKIINPYVQNKALQHTMNPWSIFVDNTVANVLVEYKFGSDEQLDLFLAGVAFDVTEDRSVTGVHEASQALLSKAPEKLTPAEVALLASAINYPVPIEGYPQQRIDQEEVLQRMHDEGLITKGELDVALQDPSVRRERFPASEDD